MPLRGSPRSRLRRAGGAPCGLAKPVPRVHWYGLLRGLRNDEGVPVSEGASAALAPGGISLRRQGGPAIQCFHEFFLDHLVALQQLGGACGVAAVEAAVRQRALDVGLLGLQRFDAGR